MKLNRTQPFGKISPPLMEDDFDRPAHFEQGGKLYDAHDRVIEPGKPIKPDPVDDHGGSNEGDTPVMPASQLLADADVMPWARFKAQAKLVLGTTCPGDKTAIKEALREAIAKHQERHGKHGTKGNTQANGLSWDGVTGKSTSGSASVGVNLAAWGMGQTEYLFGEVQKAIRTTYAKQVTERRDAVDFLIGQGIITASNARTDV